MKIIKNFCLALFDRLAARQWWLVLLWCALVWVTVSRIDLFELLYEFSRDHENLNVDEIFSVLMTLPVVMIAILIQRQRRLTREIQRRVEAEEKIRWLAFFDPMTGLPNRNMLDDRLDNAVARAKRFGSRLAVLFVDLDGFKSVNDRHGHEIGDATLRMVAQRIQGVIRDIDTVVRLGGDEFCVLLNEVGSEDEAGHVAQRLIESISSPEELSGISVRIGASVGIALFCGTQQQKSSDLLLDADRAMYEAKRQGKGRFAFSRRDLSIGV